MADLYLKDLESKVACYESTMSRCPQCRATLPTSEIKSADTPASRPSRPSRAVQQPTGKSPPPALTDPSKQLATAPMPSSSGRSSRQSNPISRRELGVSNVQRYRPSSPPVAAPNQSHRSTEAPVSNRQYRSARSSDQPATGSRISSAAATSGQPAALAQIPPVHPPSHGLSHADGRRVHAGKLVALELEHYKEPGSGSQSGRPPGESPQVANWMRIADVMLKEVPSGRQWRVEIMKMDSSVMAAVAMSAAPALVGHMSQQKDAERDKLIQLVRRFAERHSGGRANFQQFILVCLCRVLSAQGVPQRKVVKTLQICISDTGRLNIDRYLKGAVWANKMMNHLFFTDWRYRAVDLIAIWNRSIATYGAFAAAPNSHQYFMTDLTQRKYFEAYQEVLDRRHDTIPWIVKKELGDEVSYHNICEALGYSDKYILETRNLHSSQPPSPSTENVSSVGLDAVREVSLLRRQLLQGLTPINSGDGEDSSRGESVASQRTNRTIPDRSVNPLEDQDVGRRRRSPHVDPNTGELLVSSSLGESAPGVQSPKRPLPDSPTSAFQPDKTSRRRPGLRESSIREEVDYTSCSARDSNNRRGRT